MTPKPKSKEEMVEIELPATGTGPVKSKTSSVSTTHHQGPATMHRNITIQKSTRSDGVLRSGPQSYMHQLMSDPEILNDPAEHVLITERCADGSIKERVQGPFGEYSSMPPTLPGTAAAITREVTKSHGRKRTDSIPKTKGQSSGATTRPNEHGRQVKNNPSEINTEPAKIGDSHFRLTKSTKTIQKEIAMMGKRPVTAGEDLREVEDTEVLRTGASRSQQEPEMTDATQDGSGDSSDLGINSSNGDQDIQGSGGRGGRADQYEPKHWLWMNNWARVNIDLKYRDAEMAKAFNKEFGQNRNANAMKGRFQPMHESGHLDGPPKTLAFYEDTNNRPRKLIADARPGHGKAKGKKPKERSIIDADDVEQGPDESIRTGVTQTGAVNSLKLCKRDRSVVEAFGSIDSAVEPARDSSRPQKKACRRKIVPENSPNSPRVSGAPSDEKMSNLVMSDAVKGDAPALPTVEHSMPELSASSALLSAVAGSSSTQGPASEPPSRASASISASYTGIGFTAVNVPRSRG